MRRSELYGTELRAYDAHNRVWCADFKGHFAVGEQRCYPLTVTDGFSRYLLCCKAQARPLSVPTQRNFETLSANTGFRTQFELTTVAIFDASACTLIPSRRLVDPAGIRPEHIMPGRPDQNDRHERIAPNSQGRNGPSASEQSSRVAVRTGYIGDKSDRPPVPG